MHDLYQEVNVKKQEGDEESVLAFYKRALRLMKEHKDVFVYGDFEVVESENVSTFVYKKTYREKTAVVALNFTTCPQPAPACANMRLLISSEVEMLGGSLRSFEGRIFINY